MADASHEQDQLKKTQQPSETAQARPAVETPQPEFGSPPLSLSLGPGLGSPDGFEKHAGGAEQRRSANRQPRAQTLTAMQRQLGNHQVQRFMIQRRAAGDAPAVQREEKPSEMGGKAAANTITIDENGVTSVHYPVPTFTTKNDKADPATPPKDVKPDDDLVTFTATVVCVFKAVVSINLPTVPTGLTECQRKRVKDAIDNKLSPHEKLHEAAMKTYDGTVEEDFTLTGIKRSAIATERNAKAKEIANRLQKERETSAQGESDKLDKPPFEVIVDLECEDEQKPGKKAEGDTGAQPELAGGGAAESGAAGGTAAEAG